MHRTRIRAGIALVVALAVGGAVAISRARFRRAARRTIRAAGATPTSDRATPESTTPATRPPTATPPTTTTTIPHNPADDFTLTQVTTINGRISPKSVDATDTGLVFAQNMMYRHTMTVYDAGIAARS